MLEILQDFRELDTGEKALRSFGRTVGLVLVAIAVFVLWRRGWTPDSLIYILGGIGLALVLLGLTVPPALKPLYRVWMALALVLGFVMTRVLLTLVFYLAVTPTGLLLRLFGKDLMYRKPDPDAASYWLPKTPPEDPRKQLEKYY